MADSSIRAYFESERAYLRELGREFSARHHDIGKMLEDEHSDPSVERLLQGLAFLTARIRKRLDDDVPELSQCLLKVLWPQFLRPVPSLVVQQYSAPAHQSTVVRIPRGSWVSQARDPGQVEDMPECRFQTLFDVEMLPLNVVGAETRNQAGRSTVRLNLRANAGLDAQKLAALPLSRLRLYLHGEDRVPSELLFYLHRRLTGPPRLGAVAPDGAARSVLLGLPRSLGFEPEEALLPGWETAPEGWRFLFEYFVFPEKFCFVDLAGLDGIAELGAVRDFFIEFEFNAEFPRELAITGDTFRLGCAPAINLFEHSGAPLRRLPLRSEYRVLPEGQDKRHMEVFSVDRVTGMSQGRPRVTYVPFVNVMTGSPRSRPPWFDVQVREATVPGQPHEASLDPWMMLALPSDPRDLERDEKLTFALSCCNGFWPQLLRAGDLSVPRSGTPHGVSTRNLRKPTRRLLPPIGEQMGWRTVSALGMSRQNLGTREGLNKLLTLLNLRALDQAEDAATHEKRIRAIQDVIITPSERLLALDQLPRAAGRRTGQGGGLSRGLVRGLVMELHLSFWDFGGPGACFVFGMVLERALTALASVTSFTALILVDSSGRDKPIHFSPRLGERVLA